MIKALCLGAYANGNLGDMYQADALAALIETVRSDVELTSISPSKRGSSYPAARHEKGRAGGAFDPDYINQFDCLLVGGGGVLSAPHAPLNDAAWVNALQIPIFAVGIGAAGTTPSASADFIRRCARFSVRDEFSWQAVRELRPDAEIIMDPILLWEAGEPAPAREGTQGILWVPGKIVPGTVVFWSNLGQKLYVESSDSIVSFNPATDSNSGFDEAFDNVNYLDRIEPFLRAAERARLTVSERYHGCIYALARGLPCLGLALRSVEVTSKIQELYRRVGHPDCAVANIRDHSRQSLRALAESIDPENTRRYFKTERERMIQFLGECLETVADVKIA